jgi:ferredoxin
MRVSLDRNECIGCGVCVQICPDVFSMDDDAGVSKVINASGAPCAKEAADSCPVGCIHVDE